MQYMGHFERIEKHAQALATARMFQRPLSIIKFANNGSFELAYTSNAHLLPEGEATK